MIKGVDRVVESASRLVGSENAVAVTGGVIVAGFVAGNLHYQGISAEMASTSLDYIQRNLFEGRALLPPLITIVFREEIVKTGAMYINVASLLSVLPGVELTRRLIIWDKQAKI